MVVGPAWTASNTTVLTWARVGAAWGSNPFIHSTYGDCPWRLCLSRALAPDLVPDIKSVLGVPLTS